MIANDELALEQCRILLRRAAWRLQYHAKTQQLRETLTLGDYHEPSCNFADEIISDIYVQNLMNIIISEKCRYIIQKVIIEEIPEKEVASELQMSQQGVNKWKRKGLGILRQNMTHSQ